MKIGFNRSQAIQTRFRRKRYYLKHRIELFLFFFFFK